MKISVVMPAFNEERNIAETLKALAAQALPKQSFEVIVVDNGSSDETLNIVRRFDSVLTLRILEEPAGSISRVRNQGARIAVGDVLVFLDSDCVAGPTWLEDGLSLQQDRSIWGAHYSVPADATWVGSIWARYQAKEQEGATSFVPGSDLFISRKDFHEIGGFGESLQTSEDVELSARARQHGFQVLAFRRLTVSHLGTPRTLTQFYRQNRWHGKHVLRMFLANFPSTTGLLSLALALYTLLAFWMSFVLPLFAIHAHHSWLVSLPLLLLLAPPVLLSLWKTLRAGRIGDAPALTVLYLTYFLARAASLLPRVNRSHR